MNLICEPEEGSCEILAKKVLRVSAKSECGFTPKTWEERPIEICSSMANGRGDLTLEWAGMAGRYTTTLAHRVRNYLVSKKEEPPRLEVLEKLFETLFFASLRREETQPTSCRVAFIDRHKPDPKPPRRIVADRWQYFPFAEDLEFTVSSLVKLSQAVDPWGSTLAVDTDGHDELRIWGLIDQSVHF